MPSAAGCLSLSAMHVPLFDSVNSVDCSVSDTALVERSSVRVLGDEHVRQLHFFGRFLKVMSCVA